MAARYNPKHQGVRRIHADVRELRKDPNPNYCAHPLESNQFEWHFTIRGPPDSPFEGGIYHGRILLPAKYPLRPPNIMFLTPNGRFKVRTKVCLSISAHHPEYWCPAWGKGAVGSLTYSDEERRKLAKESLKYRCPVCGDPAKLLPEASEVNESAAKKSRAYAEEIMKMKFAAPTAATLVRGNSEAPGTSASTPGAASHSNAAPPSPQVDAVAAPSTRSAVAPVPAPTAAARNASATSSTDATASTPGPVAAASSSGAGAGAGGGASTPSASPVRVPATAVASSSPSPAATASAQAPRTGAADSRASAYQSPRLLPADSPSSNLPAQASLRRRQSATAAPAAATPEGQDDYDSGATPIDEIEANDAAPPPVPAAAEIRTQPAAGDVCLIMLAVLLLLSIVGLVSRRIVLALLSDQ